MELVDLNKISGQLFDMTASKALKQGICVSCKKAPKFYSEAGREEYKISALCEYCYDDIFKLEEE